MKKIIHPINFRVTKTLYLEADRGVNEYKRKHLDKKNISIHGLLIKRVELMLLDLADGKVEKYLEEENV